MPSTAFSPDASAKNFTSAHLERPRITTSKPPDDYEYPEYTEYVLPPDPCTLFWDDGCLRAGFNPFTVELAVVLVLTLLHVSMIVFLVLRGKREPAFREAFYVQFVAISVVDCLRMALVSSAIRIRFILVFRNCFFGPFHMYGPSHFMD